MTRPQFFVDESKRSGRFILAVVEVPAQQVGEYRRWLRSRLLRGQERIHFTSERRARRRELISGIVGWNPPPKVHILESGHRYQDEARDQCLIGLAGLSGQIGAERVVIERDDTRYESDKRTLTRYLSDKSHATRWDILPAKDDPLLWMADAMAWCWNNPDHEWERRIATLIKSKTRV